ncbi:MAG: ABC transporter ATP-binding protein, partial [Lachnospiraceae bacterium]|nr:ABC transporter ATP-binding protein [Lachnospiraceae bacterium]
MPEIKLTDVTKRWDKFYAVDHLDLDIEDNAFITLLGPSGCGKTTTLRMIAG